MKKQTNTQTQRKITIKEQTDIYLRGTRILKTRQNVCWYVSSSVNIFLTFLQRWSLVGTI